MKFVIRCTYGDVSQYSDKIKYQVDVVNSQKIYSIELESLEDLLKLSDMVGQQLVLTTKNYYGVHAEYTNDMIEVYNDYRE